CYEADGAAVKRGERRRSRIVRDRALDAARGPGPGDAQDVASGSGEPAAVESAVPPDADHAADRAHAPMDDGRDTPARRVVDRDLVDLPVAVADAGRRHEGDVNTLARARGRRPRLEGGAFRLDDEIAHARQYRRRGGSGRQRSRKRGVNYADRPVSSRAARGPAAWLSPRP